MSVPVSKAKAARRYLTADMNASHTGLPGEAREIHEETKRRQLKRHPGAHEHALVGSDQDFDRPLTPGEKEHQRYLRDKAGLEGPALAKRRRELRGKSENPDLDQAERDRVRRERGESRNGRARGHRRSGGRRSTSGAGRSHYRRASRFAGGTIGKTPAAGVPEVIWEVLTVGVGLSLLYLILTRYKVTTGVLGGVTTVFSRIANPEGFWAATPSPTKGVKGTVNASSRTATTGVKGAVNASSRSSAPQVGVSAPSQLSTVPFGTQLPSYGNLVPVG